MTAEKKILQLSRKQFLKSAAGASLGGLVVLGGMGTFFSGCASQEATGTPPNGASAAGQIEIPSWPFQYAKLDANKAAEKAYNAYKEGG